MLTIGPYPLPSRFLLAPMAGITDAPFRRLCRRFGAGMTTSEMTTADIRLWRTAKSTRRLDLDMDAEPKVVQIAGSEPQRLALAARLCVDRGAQIIDINMGCPAKKVCNAVDVPVTLKFRTGWDSEHRNGVEIARIAEGCGIQALAVHGRTRACRFKGQAEYETITRIKQAVSIPVIANGDITSFEKSHEVLQPTGADGLMIGRAAQGRPWIFREISCSTEHARSIPPLEKKFVRDIMLDHLSDLYQFYGETTGVRVARKHLSWYCTGLKNSEAFRFQAVRADSASEQLRLTRQYFDRAGADDRAA
jgi:tRNA-dihydrouridine synthase B